MKVSEIQEKLDEIKNRLGEVNNLFNIYNINDEESVNAFRVELNAYKELLKKISNEELKRAIK
jgi:predicted nucleotide-binding protein (sugar kinase/HSP70/actin superfamily)